MQPLSNPGLLFAAFVVVGAIGGVSLAALEGQQDRNIFPSTLLLLSFLAVIPLLIAAFVAARREVHLGAARVQQSSRRFPFLTPLRLFLFGIASQAISGAAQQFTVIDTSPLGIVLQALTAVAIPALWAAIIWALAYWTGMRRS